MNAGTSNAPEYYINMRTGTHYFPRGVSGVAAVERNCQKFGLNKIEETANESGAQAGSHRRTESLDFARCSAPIAATGAGSSVVMRTMSPDIQRRLAYQSYRGLECKERREANSKTARALRSQGARTANYANRRVDTISFPIFHASALAAAALPHPHQPVDDDDRERGRVASAERVKSNG